MGSKGSSSSSFSPPPEVVEAYREALGYGRAAMGQQYAPYTGEITAPLTPTQESGIYNVNRAVGTAIPYFGQATGLTADVAGRTITPQQFSQQAIQEYMSPYTSAVANSTFANLREQQKQEQEGLQTGAIRAGAFGGDRAGIASANLARQQDLATAQAMSNIYNQGYGQAVGLFGQQQGVNLAAQQADALRQLQAAQQLAGLGTGLQSSVLQGAQAQLAAGAQQQAVQQAINSGYYNQYLAAQAYPYQQAQFFANLATGVGGQMGGTTTGTPAQPSPVGSIFGALGALGSIMSDKRAKENIRPIGKTNDGQTIYRFNYKGDDVTQIGLLAQEVEKKHPEAVTTINGIKGVDYKEATDDSVRSMGGGVVPSSTRHNFAAGGPSINEEEDPMIPYKAGVPSKVLQIPKLARIGGSKPNFGGEPPKQPGGGPSEKDFKGAASGLGAVYNKLTTPTAVESAQKILDNSDDFMKVISNLSFALGGAATRPRFENGEEVPVTEETKTVSLGDVKPSKDDSDLPPAFRKGEIAPAADAEGTPAGGLVPRPDIPLPPESSERPRDLSYPLLRREEGFVPKAFWDVNAPRVGYSSDTKTSPEGKVERVGFGTTSTRDEAEHDLTRRVVEGQEWIKSQIGEDNWNRLSPESRAAMTSMRYQYGQYPKNVLVAATTGDNELVAKAISSAAGPTPERRQREAALIRGQDQGLGAYEPGGERYLKGGLGMVGGGTKSAPSAEASVAATTGDRKWNLGMAGEGKRSIIESIMDRDFDPIQKRALFSFFAGMAASPSPWFGQQLGAGMAAASNVYNESMNKQADLDIRKQQLGMEQQKIGIQEQLANVQEKTKAIEALKFWQSRFKQIPTAEGFSYLDTTTGQTISQDEYNSQMATVMKQLKISPTETGTAAPKPGLAPTAPAGAATAPSGGVAPQPKPEVAAPKTAVEEPKAPAAPATVEVPKPTTAAPQKPAAVEAKETPASQSAEADMYKDVRDDYNPIVLRAKADEQRKIAANAQKLGDLAGAKNANDTADSYSKKAVEITENKIPVIFKDGRVGRLPAIEQEALRTESAKESQKINVEQNTKWMNEQADAQVRRDLLMSRTNELANILETYETGRFAEQKANLVASLRAIGINVPPTATSDPAKFEQFIKNQINNVFDEVKAIGGQVRVAEIQGLQQAQAGPGMQPEANRAILGYTRGVLNWENKKFDDSVDAIRDQGINRFNRAEWMRGWSKQNSLDNYIKDGKKSVAAMGATPQDAADLEEGQHYILKKGQFGVDRDGKYVFKTRQKDGVAEGAMVPVR